MLLVATEDELSEAVALKLVKEVLPKLEDVRTMGRRGNTYLKARLPELQRTARRLPVLILTDLDRRACAADLVAEWRGSTAPDRLLLRVAVREIEAWLIADRLGLAGFFGVAPANIERDPERLPDPKAYLLQLARSARRDVSRDLCARKGSRAGRGIHYNRRLCEFVAEKWSSDRAASASDSLARALKRIREIA